MKVPALPGPALDFSVVDAAHPGVPTQRAVGRFHHDFTIHVLVGVRTTRAKLEVAVVIQLVAAPLNFGPMLRVPDKGAIGLDCREDH